MATTVSRLMVQVDANTLKAEAQLKQLGERVDKMGKGFAPATSAVRMFSMAAAAGFAGLGTQAAAGGVIQLTSALAPLAGLAGLLPGVLAGGAAAMGVFKLGTLGVSDALKLAGGDAKKFDEAIKGLSPHAQEFARAIRAAKPAFDSVQLGVQDALFKGLAGSVRSLAGAPLASLKSGLVGIAAEFNAGARSIADWVGQAGTLSGIRVILGNTQAALAKLRPAITPVLDAFKVLATVGSGYLPGLAKSVSDLAARFATFVTASAKSGALTDFIDAGITAAKQLGGILKNVGGILKTVFSAGAAAGGGGLLNTLQQVTGYANTFLKSFDGQAALKSFFASASSAAKVLLPILGSLAKAVGTSLAPALADLATNLAPALPPVIDAISQAIKNLSPAVGPVAKAFGDMLVSIAPLLPPLATLVAALARGLAPALASSGPAVVAFVAAFAGLKAIQGVGNTITGLSKGISDTVRVMGTVKQGTTDFVAGFSNAQAAASAFTGKAGTIGGALRALPGQLASAASSAASWATSTAASAGRAVAAWATSVAQTIALWAMYAAQATANAVRVAAAWVASSVTAAARAVAATAVSVAQTLALWVLYGVQAMVNAAKVAAAWLLSTGAGMVTAVASMAVAVASVVAGWVVMGVQSMIQAARMAAAWFIALGPIGWAIAAVIGLAALIIANWDTIRNATVAAWSAVSAAVVAAWNAIRAWVSSAVAAVGAAISAGWAAVRGATSSAWAAIRSAISSAWSAITGVVSGAVAAVRNAISSAWNAARSLTSSAWAAIRGAVSSGVSSMMGVVRGIPGQIRGALSGLGSLLVGSGRAIIQGLITGIRQMAGNVTGAVRGVLSAARNLLPFSPAKEGPFSGKGWTLYSGRSISQALADGIGDNQAKVSAAALGLARSAVPPVDALSVPAASLASSPTGRPMGKAPASLAGVGGAATAQTVVFNTYYPVAEKQSQTVNRSLARVAGLQIG